MIVVMKTATKKLRPALKWHGGKAYLARRIIALMPEHETYVEPFAGGLSVLLNKARARTEVAGDLHGELIAFYQTFRDQPDVLIDHLRAIPYARESFDWACRAVEGADPIAAAVRFLIKHRFSRGGMGKTFAWSERLRGGQPGDVNGWETIKAQLPVIARRLGGVQLRHADVMELIEQCDGPNTLFYLDPPYLPSTRTARSVYAHEMSQEDHERLLEVVVDVRGMVVLSGYGNPLYDHALGAWDRHEFDRPNDAGQNKTKQRRVEVLWCNPANQKFRLRHSISTTVKPPRNSAQSRLLLQV